MKLKNKKVLVYGLGDSGRAVIKVLREMQAYVSFYDDDIKYLEYVGFERRPEEKDYDLVIISPGIKCIGNKLLENFKERKIEVISELDFAYRLSKGKIIAITGTNGKTTVSMLVYRILKTAGFKTFLCGNIGLPFSAVVKSTTKDSVTVCEVSNFQLESSQYFRSDVACVLNIRPDHLDRHGSFEEYVKVKSKIANHLKSGDCLILNLDDDVAKKMVLHKKYQYFSKNKIKKGVFVWNNQIFINKKTILSLNEIPLKGDKNLENVLASVSICSHFKVSPENFSKAISSFVPVSHRMEVVASLNGVTFVDDSKATNVASTVACVEAYKDKNLILLMGGQSKEIDYSELFSLNFNIKNIVCFGADRENISRAAKEFKYKTTVLEKFDDAVNFSKSIAESGDYVLLSPACSSFDEFSSYSQRGERFKQLILKEC